MTATRLQSISKKARRPVTDDDVVTMKPLNPDNGLPLVIEPAIDGVDLTSWATSHRQLINERLYQHGGILFRGFGMAEADDLETFIQAISGDLLEYRERSSPRHKVSGNVYTSTDYPPEQHIFLHNENSYQHAWPMKIFFLCVMAPETGGETPIANCRGVLDRIDPSIKNRLIQQGVRIVRNFGGGMGLPWQTVFQTDDQATVDAYCRANGVESEWKPDGSLRTTTLRPAVAKHPVTGDPTWFNHGTFFHISTLDSALSEVLLACLDEADLPTNTYYGDGTAFTAQEMDHLRQAYRDECVMFPWERGDLLMLDNMFTAHARQPFTGERKVVVGMSEAIARGPQTDYQPG